MEALQKPGRIAGLWFLGTFVFSIPAALLYGPVLNDPNYILGEGLDARIALGALLEVLLAISNIATAVVFFSSPQAGKRSRRTRLRRVAHDRVGDHRHGAHQPDVSSHAAAEFHRYNGDTASLIIAGQTLVALHSWTFLLGPQFCAGFGNGILLGYLMYKSALVPRPMALLGLIGGPLAFIGGVFVLFGAFDQPSGPLIALTAIEVVWEASLAIYLTVKGYRPSPLLAETSSA
jgi:hypothetical protein